MPARGEVGLAPATPNHGSEKILMMQALEEELAGPLASPVQIRERIASLDVLRGVAVFGILMNNIKDLAGPTGFASDIPLELVGKPAAHPALDLGATILQLLLVQGQMRALFALLFGAGVVLLLERVTRQMGVERAADIFHRRNMWLLLIGVIHGSLIWYGDVLLQYSVIALLFLYPLRHLAARRLIVAGLVMSFAATTISRLVLVDPAEVMHSATVQEAAFAARSKHQSLTDPQQTALDAVAAADKTRLQLASVESVEGRRGYVQTESENAHGQLQFLTLLFTSGLIFEVVGFMIAGMGLYKTGFLSASLSTSTYVMTAVLGYAISIPIVLIGFHHAQLAGFSTAVVTKWLSFPYSLHQIPGVLATTSLLLLAVRKRIMLPVQRGLAAVGRMALSNYILSSVVCQVVFRWGPIRLYGVLEYYQYFLVMAGVWLLQLVFSLIWLRIFAFGPLEWAWRSLTYWQRQRLVAVAT